MANYSLISQGTFEPYSYQEMLAPVLLATQSHQDLESKYDELSTSANIWEGLANEQTDEKTYKQYKKFADDLRNQVEILAKEGLTSTSRRGMLDMKSRYAKEIVPIEKAYAARQKHIEEQREMRLKDPTWRPSIDAATTSLDKYLENPQLDYESVSGALVTKRVSDAVKNYADSILTSSDWRSAGPNREFLERVQQYGLTRNDIEAIRNNPNAFPEITKLINDVVESTGVNAWGDDATKAYTYASAYEGLYSGLGKRTIDVRNNPGYLNEYEQWKWDQEKNKNPEESDEGSGEEIYFPEIEIGTTISDPVDFDITGLKLDAEGNLTSKEIEDLDIAIQKAGISGNKSGYSNNPYNNSVRHSNIRSSIRNYALAEAASKNGLLESLKQQRRYLSSKGMDTTTIDKSIAKLEAKVKNLSIEAQEYMHDPAANLKSKKREKQAEIQKYYDKYKHLSKDPLRAVSLGVALDKQQRAMSNTAKHVIFGSNKERVKNILDIYLSNAIAGTTTGIYEVDEHGIPTNREIKKEDLPKDPSGLSLYSTDYGLMMSDIEGNKYLISQDNVSKNIHKEATAIITNLTDFSAKKLKKVIKPDGNILQYNDSELANLIISNNLGERKEGVITATFELPAPPDQPEGDIINVVVYDVNSGNPKVAYASMKDIISGGYMFKSSMDRYKSYRGAELIGIYENRTPSTTLTKGEVYLTN